MLRRALLRPALTAPLRRPSNPLRPHLANQLRPSSYFLLKPSGSHSPQPAMFSTSGGETKELEMPKLILEKEMVCSSQFIPEKQPAMLSTSVDGEEEIKENGLEMLRLKLLKEGIDIKNLRPKQYGSLICPKCEGGNSKDLSFSVFVREDGLSATWNCHRGKCGWTGGVMAFGQSKNSTVSVKKEKQVSPRKFTEEELRLEPLCDEILSYFSLRGISPETLRRNGVKQRKSHGEMNVAFPYRINGNIVSCKYRGANKKFYQEPGTERIFYGLDDIKIATDVIIVEGEIDKLSMDEAGFSNCVSAPDGAPPKVSSSVPNKEQDTKYQFLWNCKEYLDQASRIILATDSDDPGQALAEEIARRVGKARCWRVTWPEGCKDANEVLVSHGRDTLKNLVDEAEMYPVRGLLRFSAFFHEIDAYYNQSLGYDLGISTGWTAVDAFYKVLPGELTIVSGIPNSGKSEWIDALMCNINKSNGWTYVLCSMENMVREHARKLLEKHFKKPFLPASYAESTKRIDKQELEQGKNWLNDTFHLIRYDDDCLPSIDYILERAKIAVVRYGIRGLVIDPYNELDHQRPPIQTETEYVSKMLTKVKRFAQHHGCHVWFVAHPKQLQQWTGAAPSMYDISGSAHFINKCDNGIVIHRNRDENAGPLDQVQVCVRKVRNKVVGQIGDAFLTYSRINGVYTDIDGGYAICKPKQNKLHS